MNKGTKDFLIGSVAIGAAALAIYYATAGRSEKVNLDTYTVLGTVAAEETAKLAGNKGKVLLMIPDSGPSKNPSVEAEVKAFEQTLKKQKEMAVVSERVPVTAMTMLATGGGVPPELFLKALEKNQGVKAVVLFFAFPELDTAGLEKLKQSGARTVVVSSFRSGYQRLLDQKAIHMVITPRQDTPPANPQPPKTVREKFDQDFSIISPTEPPR